MNTDQLIERLRARASDPARRVDVPQTELGASIASMGLGDMLAMVGSLGGDLERVVEANRAGKSLGQDIVERAERLGASMTTPVPAEPPGAVDAAVLDLAEVTIGQPLPAAFRRIYGEVADGGFGPGAGLLPIETILATYRELVADPPAPRGLAWPPAIIPLVDLDPGYYCLGLPDGRVIDWDPEVTSESQDAEGWARSFREIAPDLETWLGAWVVAPGPAEAREAEMARLRREGLRSHLQTIAAMTPAEREAIGLPAVGWESAFLDEEDL